MFNRWYRTMLNWRVGRDCQATTGVGISLVRGRDAKKFRDDVLCLYPKRASRQEAALAMPRNTIGKCLGWIFIISAGTNLGRLTL